MSSSSSSPRRSPEAQQKPKPNKIFVTNLDIEAQPKSLETDLFEKFTKYGKLDTVVVKRSYNNKYSFAFIEYRDGEDATLAVNELNNTTLNGKKIKVELQDNTRRRKGGDQVRVNRTQACYVCGKPGHFAKNCRQNREKEEIDRKSQSSVQRHKKKSKKRRHRSSSSESRAPKRKDKKQRSRKIKKSKHKKDRKRSRSDSSA